MMCNCSSKQYSMAVRCILQDLPPQTSRVDENCGARAPYVHQKSTGTSVDRMGEVMSSGRGATAEMTGYELGAACSFYRLLDAADPAGYSERPRTIVLMITHHISCECF